MPRVILFKGSFQYDAVNLFVDGLAAGLAALGREIVIIDLTVDSERSRIHAELARPFECIVAFGAIGARPQEVPAGSHMYDRLTAPYVGVLVDHPVYGLERFGTSNMIITCFDRTHVAFLRKYFAGAKRVEFLPHGGSTAEHHGTEPRDFADILFPGTYMDPDAAYAMLKAAPADVFEVMDFVVERLLVTDCEPLEDALAAVLLAEGRGPEWKEHCAWLPLVDKFNRAYKRTEILRRLDAAGIAVDILGNQWPQGLFRHHRIRPALPYREVLRLMRRSRIVLSLALVPDGSHERIYSAVLNGALPASDYNRYLDESLASDGNALLFRWTQLEGLADRVAAVLDDRAALAGFPARAAQLAQAHTWAARAASLLALVKGTAGA